MIGAGAGGDDKRQKEKGRFKLDSINDLGSSSDAAPQSGFRDCLYSMSSIYWRCITQVELALMCSATTTHPWPRRCRPPIE
jgi:hypothetical protein